METFYGDTEESTEDIPGRKKSKLKSLKTRLFGKSKRAGGEENAKLSQSESDITAGQGLGSEEDLTCSHGTMGSRALSHDSIFLADQVLTDAQPARVLSQENVHSKIKALQMKLQQQNLHLGPPPLVLPLRRPEDLESRCEDDGLPQSPPEMPAVAVTTQAALCKTMSQPLPRPLSPVPKPAPSKSVPHTLSHPSPFSAPSNSSVVEAPLDFSSPAQFTPCLDTSAARHRMSIKPRNQRASTKKKLTSMDSSHTLNNIDHPEPVREEELSTEKEMMLESEQGGAISPTIPQHLPSKSPEAAPITPEAASKSSSLLQTSLQQDQAPPVKMPTVPSQVLRVKPHRPDVMSSERPHSSFIPSELKDKGEDGFEIAMMSHDKRNTLNKVGFTEGSSEQLVPAFRSHTVQQQVHNEAERGIKRPGQGSGSFHFSISSAKNREEKRPRSGSFVGVLEQLESRHRTEDKPLSGMRDKAELRDLQPRGGPFTVGKLRQDGAVHKSPAVPWDRRDSLKKVESAAAPKSGAADTGIVEAGEAEGGQPVAVEEAAEAQEVEGEERKSAFGVKLRTTSQSIRLRSDVASKENSKPAVSEEQCDRQKTQEISDTASHTCRQMSTNVSGTPSTVGDPRLTDPAPSGFSLPVKHNPPSTGDLHVTPTDVQAASSTPKEDEPAFAATQDPQQPPPTASWMSMAMEKTRSLQQLFTSRFPRDFTAPQATAQPQAQAPTPTAKQTLTQAGAQIQTQTVKLQSTTTPEAEKQPSGDEVKADPVRSRGQSVKPLSQQKTSTASQVPSNSSREPQASKQTNEPQLHPNTTQCASQSASIQTNPWTAQSPLHSSTQRETSSQFAQGNVPQSLAQSYLSSGQQQQQPPWTNRGHHAVSQLKSTTPPVTSAPSSSSSAAPPQVSAVGRGEKEATTQEKEGASLPGRRAVWAGSVSEKAAFLEKRTEWTITPGTKGVELKKAQTEAPASGESPASVKIPPPSKDTKPEGRQGVKPAESSPTKVPDRPREDKWVRKHVPSSSPHSSSPTMPSALQSMSDSSQPSWMELAKRKSMAWSDKSMD